MKFEPEPEHVTESNAKLLSMSLMACCASCREAPCNRSGGSSGQSHLSVMRPRAIGVPSHTPATDGADSLDGLLAPRAPARAESEAITQSKTVSILAGGRCCADPAPPIQRRSRPPGMALQKGSEAARGSGTLGTAVWRKGSRESNPSWFRALLHEV